MVEEDHVVSAYEAVRCRGLEGLDHATLLDEMVLAHELSHDQVDDVINEMLDRGMVYEPVLGCYKDALKDVIEVTVSEDDKENNAIIKVDDDAPDPGVQLIEVKNLIVSPAPLRRIALADVDSLQRAIKDPRTDVKGIIWNEYEIALITSDGMDVRFKPIFDQSTTVFFEQDKERYRGGWADPDDGKRIWEGEFAPVMFTKTSLLRYLKQYSKCFDETIQAAVRELKVRASTTSKEVMLDDDGDAQRNVEEITSKTNIPKTFTAVLPMFDGLTTKIKFEAVVKKKEGKTLIELRCTNAREALKWTMLNVVSDIQGGLPAYYGAMNVQLTEGRR